MTDKHHDAAIAAAVQRIMARIDRYQAAYDEAKSVVDAAPAHGVVSARTAKTLLEAIETLLVQKGRDE